MKVKNTKHLSKAQLDELEFSSIWIRLCANIIDSVLLSLVAAPLLYTILSITLSVTLNTTNGAAPVYTDEQVRTYFTYSAVILAMSALYTVLMPLTKLQGTLGKRIMKIKIISSKDGKKINLSTSIKRYLILSPFSIVSDVIALNPRLSSSTLFTGLSVAEAGYVIANAIVAANDDHTQGWHDKAAKTYVVNR